jgi:hypothetical protein
LHKELLDILNIRFAVYGSVGTDAEPLRLGGPDPCQGFLKSPFPADDVVMDGFGSIEMDIPCKMGMRPEKVKGFFEKNPVCTEVDVLALDEQFLDEFLNMGIEQRFTTRDGDDRRSRFIYGLQTLFQGHFFMKRVMILANAPASRTGKVAAVSGFKHQYQRVVVVSLKFFLHEITGHGSIKTYGKTHGELNFLGLFAVSDLIRERRAKNRGQGIKSNGVLLFLFS